MMAQFCYQVPLISEMKVIVRWTNFPAEIQFISQDFIRLGENVLDPKIAKILSHYSFKLYCWRKGGAMLLPILRE